MYEYTIRSTCIMSPIGKKQITLNILLARPSSCLLVVDCSTFVRRKPFFISREKYHFKTYFACEIVKTNGVPQIQSGPELAQKISQPQRKRRRLDHDAASPSFASINKGVNSPDVLTQEGKLSQFQTRTAHFLVDPYWINSSQGKEAQNGRTNLKPIQIEVNISLPGSESLQHPPSQVYISDSKDKFIKLEAPGGSSDLKVKKEEMNYITVKKTEQLDSDNFSDTHSTIQGDIKPKKELGELEEDIGGFNDQVNTNQAKKGIAEEKSHKKESGSGFGKQASSGEGFYQAILREALAARPTSNSTTCPHLLEAVHFIEKHNEIINFELYPDLNNTQKDNKESRFLGMTILFAAVKNGSHDMVLNLLRNGASLSHKNKMGKTALQYSRDILQDLNNQKKSNSGIKSIVMDFELKCLILETYRKSTHVMDLSRKIESFSLTHVRTSAVKHLVLSKRARMSQSQDRIFCSMQWDQDQVYSTPEENLPVYTSANVSFIKASAINIRMNKLIPSTYQDRRLIVEVFKGEPHGERILLSRCSIKGGNILSAALAHKSDTLVVPLKPSTYLDSGMLEIEVKELPPDHAYKVKKRGQLRQDLDYVINAMSNYSDFSVQKYLSLCFHAGSEETLKSNLLNSAIHLGNVYGVEKLLSLGLRPSEEDMELSQLLSKKRLASDSSKIHFLLNMARRQNK